MSWRPGGSVPDHPVERYHLRVAKVEDASGSVVGYALVEREVVWQRVAGTLWWKRFGSPETCAVVYLTLHGEWEERLMPASDLTARILDWDRGRWVEESEDGRTVDYLLTWHSYGESAVLAEKQLGIDIEWLRRVHRHSPSDDAEPV